MKKKMTFALCFCNRGFMPGELIYGARDDMVKAVTDAGYDYIMMDKELTRYGGVETRDEGLLYAKWLKKHEGQYDGVIFSMPIFDAENGAYLDWNATNHYRTIDFYKSFLAAHPNNHSAHLWLLDLLIADRRCAEAREVLDKMHRLKPTYNDDFYLGCILLQEGHTDDALAQWEAMCAKYPDTWEVYVMRASELAKLAHYDEAIADYEKAMALMPPPRFVDPAEAIAQICEIRGDYETAITYYEKVIAIEKADWHETQGEAIDAPQRSIARLREKLASR